MVWRVLKAEIDSSPLRRKGLSGRSQAKWCLQLGLHQDCFQGTVEFETILLSSWTDLQVYRLCNEHVKITTLVEPHSLIRFNL